MPTEESRLISRPESALIIIRCRGKSYMVQQEVRGTFRTGTRQRQPGIAYQQQVVLSPSFHLLSGNAWKEARISLTWKGPMCLLVCAARSQYVPRYLPSGVENGHYIVCTRHSILGRSMIEPLHVYKAGKWVSRQAGVCSARLPRSSTGNRIEICMTRVKK